MIDRQEIEETLQWLKECHDAPSHEVTSRQKAYFAKLAILELFGWTEESMKNLVETLAARKLKGASASARLQDTIKSVHGFRLKNHFLRLLGRLGGLVLLETIEDSVDSDIRAGFNSALENLYQKRCRLAHTYVKGTTTTIDAPSATLGLLPVICEGLSEFEKAIAQI